jgi:hypothetical protein
MHFQVQDKVFLLKQEAYHEYLGTDGKVLKPGDHSAQHFIATVLPTYFWTSYVHETLRYL